MRSGHFRHRGYRFAYTTYGSGEAVCVLLPGLLMPARMNRPLAEELARRGYRAITFDPLGHGDSDHPAAMSSYNVGLFADDVMAMLDHLQVERAAVAGMSLGANVALEIAVRAPQRVAALVIEMPALDNALLAAALTFTPVLGLLTLGEPFMQGVAWMAKRTPRFGLPLLLDVILDAASYDPPASGALLQGLLYGRLAPPHEERRRLQMPALVLGHHQDPVHPFSDADKLARELPHGRLRQARTVFDRWFWPEKLGREVGDFLQSCWPPAATSRPQVRSRALSGRRRSPATAPKPTP